MSNKKDDEPRVIVVIGSSPSARFLPGVEARLLLEKLDGIAIVGSLNDDHDLNSFSFSGLDPVFELKRAGVVPELPKAFFFKEDNSSRNNSWKRARHEANRNAGLKFKGKK